MISGCAAAAFGQYHAQSRKGLFWHRFRYDRAASVSGLRHLAFALVLGATPSLAYAQAAPPSIQGNVPPPGSPLPGLAAPQAPPVSPGPPPAPPAAPAPVNPNLIVAVTDVAVDGVTAYAPGTFAAVTAGLTGPAVKMEDVEAARTAIVNRYRRDDYVYTAVNARLHGTHLTLVVIESRIVSVKLRQDVGPVGAQVLRFLNHLTEVQPITNAALERWLLLANDIPGLSVKSYINPSTTDPGALTLEADVTRQPVSASLRLDNRAFRQTGPEELLATMGANSFTSLGERSEVSFYHTLNNTDNFGQALEEFFIGGSGLKLRIYGGAGESNPSGSLRELGYDGVTRVFGAELSYPLIRSRRQTLVLSALFDGVESDISYGVTGTPVRASFDSLRVLRADGLYTLYDSWLGAAFGATDSADVKVSQGLPILGASSNGDPQLPRLNERVDFTKASLDVERHQSLFSPYPGSEVSILGAVAGQFTNNILPPEEKAYLGGPVFNRGFYYGEVTGDRALQAKIEPQFDTPLPVSGFTAIPVSAQFYGFYDWGEVWQEQTLDLGHTLRSIGGGVRTTIGRYVELDVEGVSRLTRTPDGPTPAVSRLKSSAFYWQVLLHY